MRIYIDVSVLTLATFVTGIQRVTMEVATRLIASRGDDVVLLHYNAKEHIYYRIDNAGFCAYYRHGRGAKNAMITKQRVEFAQIGQGSVFFDLDAAWMCRVKRSWLLPQLKKQGARIVAHIYDIISVTHPQYCLQRGVYNFMDYIGAHLEYADEIIVNAKATVEELEKLTDRLGIPLPPCHVVPLGADFGKREIVSDEEVPDELVRIVKSAPYLLMVGTVEPRKNHKLLLEAYDARLKALGYHVIFAGYMGWNMEAFAQRLHRHPDFRTGIFHLEGLNDTAISYLYQHAKFLVFCSYTEGYGLPVIEAILRGVPTLAADIGVLREVGQEYCVWFEQDRVEDLCEKVSYLHDHPDAYEAQKRKLAQYKTPGWGNCAKRMEDILFGQTDEDRVKQ